MAVVCIISEAARSLCGRAAILEVVDDAMESAPRRADYADVRDFFHAHETYWDQVTPSRPAILARAAQFANDAAVAIDMQLVRIGDELRGGDPDAFWKALIDVEFLVSALWRMRAAGNLAASAMGKSWTPLDRFNQALPDLELMRHVAQHVDEYGRDGDSRRQFNPTTAELVGRRSLHVMSFGEWSFNWLGGTIDFDRARKASFALLSAIRTARDEASDATSE